MEDKFDIKYLHSRIAELKKQSEESIKFTREYLECLIKRHDLKNIIHEDHEFDNVPVTILDSLKNGIVPSEEELCLIDSETQDYLIKDCVYMCGLGAICWYCDNIPDYKELQPSPFDEILEMSTVSPGHYTASYIIAGLTLLMSDLPSQEIVEVMTNNFDSSEDQVERNFNLFNEICVSILKRYMEDKEYYAEGV